MFPLKLRGLVRDRGMISMSTAWSEIRRFHNQQLPLIRNLDDRNAGFPTDMI